MFGDVPYRLTGLENDTVKPRSLHRLSPGHGFDMLYAVAVNCIWGLAFVIPEYLGSADPAVVALGRAYSRKWLSDLLVVFTGVWAFALTDRALTVAEYGAGAGRSRCICPCCGFRRGWDSLVAGGPGMDARPRCCRGACSTTSSKGVA